MLAGKSFGSVTAGCVAGVVALVVGDSGGNSGIGGTGGRPSLVALADTNALLLVDVVGLGAGAAGDVAAATGGATDVAEDGHAGVFVSAESDAPLVADKGGTLSGVWLHELLAAACGCMGPWLIFT
ncbi:MAG TPA: hypothetical protein VFW73_04855 [Lacipirellulaceae bacterium]|nr:hypothetical protein [Lacipirellulaceae bacterium]